MPYERSFSVQNFVITKARNRLSPVKADKLQFIYINKRVLAKEEPKLVHPKGPAEEEWETEGDSELEPEPVPDENNWLGMTEEEEVEREDLTNITIDLAGSEEEDEEEVEEMVPEERPQLGTKRSHDFLSTVL